MKMLTLKTTTIALMAALLSTNVYAMGDDEDFQPGESGASIIQEIREQKQPNDVLRKAVGGYWLDLTATDETLLEIRNIINQVLNMENNGPSQEAVDAAFGNAIRSSANQYSGDLRLIQIMLLDRNTRQLRTGLRPSNETIQYHRDSNHFTDQKITNYLNTLNL
jgi:hypothetical protein